MKPGIEKYHYWVKEKFDIDLYSKPKQIYEYVSQKLFREFENTEFWIEFQQNLREYNDEYYLTNEYNLLKVEKIPLLLKSYDSLVNKTYRKNILLNKNFPDPPEYNWILPENWFTSIKDLLRTSITVRYLDGVEFLANKIHELCNKHSYLFEVEYEAREEGYYAAHVTIKKNSKIVDYNWDENEILFPIEIQITTQLQEVIKSLLHKMYEEVRIADKEITSMKWQWDYKTKEFSSNYLGHILHYVEGMILDVRDKQKSLTK